MSDTAATQAEATVKVEIRNRWFGHVLYTAEIPADTPSGLRMRAALEQAIQKRVNLRGSNLSGSDLSDSNLSGSDLSDSNLSGSDLSRSNLSGSNLSGSDLSDSNLSGSDLRGSNLSGSDLSDSDLRGSNLSGSDLSDSNLSRSNLSGSDLSDSNLRHIRADFFDVLLRAPHEVPALRDALVEGRVNGSTYEGECACLVGTIANARGVRFNDLGHGLTPCVTRPAERWFLGIQRGDTPDTNQISRITVEWVDEFLGLIELARAA